MVCTSNVRNGQLTMEDAKFTDAKDYSERTWRTVPRYGGILFAREASAGEHLLRQVYGEIRSGDTEDAA